MSNIDREAYIISHGAFAPERNPAIYDKWFRKSPRYLFKESARRYGLAKKRLCDVGCSYGMNLMYCDPASYGIEINPEEVKFARSIGLNVYNRDVVKDDLSDMPKVDAIWCCAVLEHVDAPHVFLRRISTLLDPGGLGPTIPGWPWRLLKYIPFMRKHMIAHTHTDHVNAFTPSTLKFMCERAGFETIEVNAMYPGPLKFLGHWLFALDGVMYVGRKKKGSAYSGNSTRIGKAEYFDDQG